MLNRSSACYVILLYVCDILLTLGALALSATLRPFLLFGKEVSQPGGTLTPEIYLTTFIVWSFVLAMSSAYDARSIMHGIDEAKAVLVGVSQSTLILAGFLYLTYRGLSRLLFVTFFISDIVLILLLRMGLRLALKASGRSATRGINVLIIGTNKVAASVGGRVADLHWMGLQLLGYVSVDGICPDPDLDDGQEVQLNASVLGKLADVPRLVDALAVRELVIAVPLRALDELPNMVAQLVDLPINIKVVPDFFDLVFFRTTTEDLGGMPLIGIKEPVLSPSMRVVKRALDITIASAGLIVLAPVMVVVALLIKLDSPGPGILRQQRVGEGGRLFWMYKFRTMIANAAEQQGALMHRDGQGNVVFEKRPDDPRVTRLGRILRHYSVDEFPQFVNVLRGEMSLVGPRPELPMIVQNYQPWQRKRFAVPPGMTGWWQVRGRSQQPMNMRTEDDLYYIQNYSILLDLHILWKTIGAVISGRGAY